MFSSDIILQRRHSKKPSRSKRLDAERTGPPSPCCFLQKFRLELSQLFLSSLAPVSWFSHVQNVFSTHQVHGLWRCARPCHLLFKARQVEKKIEGRLFGRMDKMSFEGPFQRKLFYNSMMFYIEYGQSSRSPFIPFQHKLHLHLVRPWSC